MDDKQLFRLGFLTSCAEQGMSVDEANALARSAMEKQSNTGATLAWLLAGIAAAGGAGALLGQGTGRLAHRAVSPPMDPADERRRELRAAYLQGAATLRNQQAQKAAPKPPPRIASI